MGQYVNDKFERNLSKMNISFGDIVTGYRSFFFTQSLTAYHSFPFIQYYSHQCCCIGPTVILSLLSISLEATNQINENWKHSNLQLTLPPHLQFELQILWWFIEHPSIRWNIKIRRSETKSNRTDKDALNIEHWWCSLGVWFCECWMV